MAAAEKKKKDKKKGKGKMKGRNSPAAVVMKARGAASAERSNPFEAIWSRRKFDVLGKKRKGEEHRVARSRSEATHKRENTLLKRFEQSAKSSVFHDRRIGERDDTLPEFDKAILRQQREHMAKLNGKANTIYLMRRKMRLMFTILMCFRERTTLMKRCLLMMRVMKKMCFMLCVASHLGV